MRRPGRAPEVSAADVKLRSQVSSPGPHRGRAPLAVVQAAHPAVPPLVQLQPPGTPGTAATAVKPKLIQCQHYAPNVTAVLDQVTGERLAWYCQACDQQLPANWALSEGQGR